MNSSDNATATETEVDTGVTSSSGTESDVSSDSSSTIVVDWYCYIIVFKLQLVQYPSYCLFPLRYWSFS